MCELKTKRETRKIVVEDEASTLLWAHIGVGVIFNIHTYVDFMFKIYDTKASQTKLMAINVIELRR